MSTETIARRTPALHVPEWEFSDRLRKIRKDAGLTQGEMAALLGMKKSALGHWETGFTHPRDMVATAKRIESALGVPAAWTLGVWDDELVRHQGLEPQTRWLSVADFAVWESELVEGVAA